ncbi:MAG: DUF2382 domain-containing protein [Mycetocola sp.]
MAAYVPIPRIESQAPPVQCHPVAYVGTQKVQTGKARLRKYVVTEQQTVSEEVAHEEIELEGDDTTVRGTDRGRL